MPRKPLVYWALCLLRRRRKIITSTNENQPDILKCITFKECLPLLPVLAGLKISSGAATRYISLSPQVFLSRWPFIDLIYEGSSIHEFLLEPGLDSKKKSQQGRN